MRSRVLFLRSPTAGPRCIRSGIIQPNHFSWAADLSTDGGATWVRDYLRIEATRRVRAASTK